MSLFAELKRRNVIRVAAAYLVIGWLVVQVVDVLAPMFDIGSGFQRGIVLLLLVSFIPVMFFTWAYEITAEGIKKEAQINRDESLVAHTTKKLDIITLLAVAAAGGMFAYQQINPATRVAAPESATQMPRVSSDNPEPTTSADVVSKITTTTAETNSIAVLPFVNMSSDEEQTYFADGISEEILNALVKANGLRVAGRTSSFSFRGKDDTIKQIAAALNVAHVLEGSVRKQGNKVRITAQLIEADTEFHLWSETYDGTLDNIFDLQESISREVTNELKVILNLGEAERLANDLTDNVDAYDLFLRGRQAVGKRVNGELENGLALLQQAVKLDPSFAEAWASMAEAESVSSGYVVQSADEQEASLQRAEQYARKALELDNQLALPHLALGGVTLDRDNILQAITEFEQALEVAPNLTLAMRWLGNAYAMIGRIDLAFPLHEKAYRLEPLSAVDAYNMAASNYKKDNLEEAIRFYRISGDIRGNGMPDIGYVYLHQGKHQVAKQFLLKVVNELAANEVFPHVVSGRELDIYIAGLLGDTEQARAEARTLAPTLRKDADDVTAWQLGDHIRLYNFDRAFEILEQKPAFFGAFAMDYAWLPDTAFKAFRADPRFTQLLTKRRVPEAWQAIGWPELCQPTPGTDGSNGQFACR